jgi:hypothetical protein
MLAALVAGCGGEVDMSRQGLPPWHLWGGSKTITHVEGTVQVDVVTQQIARVSYARPESWNFLFNVTVLDSKLTSGNVDVQFDLVTGLGRNQTTIKSFEHYIFVVPLAYKQIYSTSVHAPERVTSAAPASPQNIIDHFVAQDIQLNATVSFGGLTIGDRITMQVDGYFSPINHIRPEWYAGQFAGGEDAGK